MVLTRSADLKISELGAVAAVARKENASTAALSSAAFSFACRSCSVPSSLVPETMLPILL